jgi:FtsP/CotA-like multicopper oxidase with cupredoxin domain
MRFLGSILVGTWVASATMAAQVPESHVIWGAGGKASASTPGPRYNKTPFSSRPKTQVDQSCLKNIRDRSCWSQGHNITTDFDLKWPNTGKIRRYNLEITNTTCAPDGIRRQCLLINGQYPGPKIEADWGDTIEVTLKNSLKNNGTGLHWHGIRQILTTTQDG